MLTQKQIKEIITSAEIADTFAWVIDIANDHHTDPDFLENGYVYFIGPYEKNIQKMAHKIACKGFYSCKIKMQKAIRRLMREISLEDSEKIYYHIMGVLYDIDYENNKSIIKIK